MIAAAMLAVISVLSAAEFDGSGDHIDFGAWDVPASTTSLTVICWVKFNNFTVADQRIFSKATDQQEADHWVMFSGNTSSQMRARLKTGGTTTTHLETSSAINAGQWYHMGFVYNGSNIIFYRDGAQNGSSAKSGTVSTSGAVDARIGDNPGPTRKQLNGFVDDCRIYTRALSQPEVQTIHAARGRDRIVFGLLSRWMMNEGPIDSTVSGANSIKDLRGADHGTPGGDPQYRAGILTWR